MSRRNFLEGAVSLAACSYLPGCGYSVNPNYHAANGVALPMPPGSLTLAKLSIHGTTGGVIPAQFVGLSYEKTAISYNYFHSSNHNLIALFRLLGAGVLRIGGGSVDRIQWTAASTGNHLQVTASNIKQLASFLKAAGWRCIYGVNFAASTPQAAAAEAAAVFHALGESLLGIEIGNEPDDYGAPENYFAGNWSYLEFLARWQMFRTAIEMSAPGTPVTGPACGGGNHIPTWTIPFGEAAAREIVLLTQHYYRLSGASPLATAEFLVSPDNQLTGDLTTLGAGAARLGIDYRISECNSFSNGGAIGVSNSYASALWAIDFLFNNAFFGSSGVNMHGGGSAPGYTPIADDSGAVTDVRPEYYGLLFFSLVGQGTLLGTTLVAGTANATAYAVQGDDGEVRVMVLNKETEQNLVLTLDIGRTIQNAVMLVMQGPGLAATSGVTIQGAGVATNGSFNLANATTLTPSETRVTFPVLSLTAALITIT